MDDAASHTGGDPRASRRRMAAPFVAGAVVLGVGLVVCATWLVGPAPKAADEGLPPSPPPLALPTGTPTASPVARAAALLATGDLDAARTGFVDVVAEDPDGATGLVGLALSQWRSTGPWSVEASLRQLALEHPDSALVALHLGLVEALLDEGRAARAALRDAQRLGRATTDPTGLRMASLAGDLLHPNAFRGSMPILVRPEEVAVAHRPALRRMLAAIAIDDRRTAALLAGPLTSSADPMLQVAAVAATFDKDDPLIVAARLDALALDQRLTADGRDRARLHASLARLWTGDGRADGCRRLRASISARTSNSTRELASPIHAELCR